MINIKRKEFCLDEKFTFVSSIQEDKPRDDDGWGYMRNRPFSF